MHGFCPLGEITMIPFIYSWWCIIVLVRRIVIRLCLERIESNQTEWSDWLKSMLTAVKFFPFWPIKMIPQKRKIIWHFFHFFIKYSLPMSFSEDTIRKRVHCACLRDMTGQSYPTYASTSSFSRASFHSTFFGSWKQGFSKWTLKKKNKKTWKAQSLEGRKRYYI